MDSCANVHLLSEEGELIDSDFVSEMHSDVLVIDPLDGTSNFAVGLPWFGFMAAHVRNCFIRASLVVLPSENLYLTWNESGVTPSRTLPKGGVKLGSSVYFAYSSMASLVDPKIRKNVFEVSDRLSAGVYRYGSCCLALFNLLVGRHAAFVGLQIYIWDVIAFWPILVDCNFQVWYCLRGNRVDLAIGREGILLDELLFAVGSAKGTSYVRYEIGQPLVST